MLPYKHIAIEGNIGAGKTTLAKFLAERLNASLLLEEFEENEFLQDFYEDNQFALHAEVQFLLDRSKQLFKFHTRSHQQIIADYIPQKSLLFAKMNLTTKEFGLVKELMESVYNKIPRPDLLIFLNRSISELENNIKERGRGYESNISSEYLISLNKGYDALLSSITDIPILQIRASEINLNKPDTIFDRIKEILEQPHETGLKRVYL